MSGTPAPAEVTGPPTDDRLRRRETVAFWAIVVGFNLALAVHVYTFGFFHSDDYPNFTTARGPGLPAQMLSFVDVHFAPLFRLVNWLLLRGFGLNFAVAVVFLAALQLLSVSSLHALLQRLSPGRAARMWTVLYACSMFLVVPFAFWSAALHRIPCLLFTILAVERAARYGEDGRLRHWLAAQLAFVAALGFFEKALLVPVYIGGLEVCRWLLGDARDAALRRAVRLALCLAPMLALAGAFYAFVGSQRGWATGIAFDANAAWFLLSSMPKILLQGPFFTIHAPDAVVTNSMIWAAYAFAFALTVVQTPRALAIWVVGLVWIALHALILSFSIRREFVWFLPQVYRYYFEMMLPLVLAGSLLTAAVRRFGRPGWRLPRPTSARTASYLFAGALLVYGVLGFARSVALDYASYPQFPEHRRRMLAVIENARALAKSGESLAVLDTPLHESSAGMLYGWITYRQIFELVDVSLPYNVLANYLYAVNPAGELEPVYLSIRGELFPSPSAQLVRAELAADGCLLAHNGFGNFIDIDLPLQWFENAALVFDDHGPQPGKLLFYYRVAPDQPWKYRHDVVLPGDGTTVVSPVVSLEPRAPLALAGVRIELPIREQPYCLRSVRLAEYSLRR